MAIVGAGRLLDLAKGVPARIAGLFRVEDPRWLFWSVYYPYNFGDWIGPFLFQKITGASPWFAKPNRYSRSTVYMAAGSILSAVQENAIVWGSGVIRRTDAFPRPWKTLAVRGPISREVFLRMGYPCPEVYGDPALLLPLVYEPTIHPEKAQIGVVPHFRDLERVKALYRTHEEIRVIDVRHPVEQVVDHICSCERILSSSLHGLIVAHAYGISARWVRWGHLSGDGTKYHDYFRSVDLEPYEPNILEECGAHEAERLASLAEESERPKMESIQSPLLAACPFKKPER